MSAGQFVPFNFDGIDGLEYSPDGNGFELLHNGVIIRVVITNGAPPLAALGFRGPRGGWCSWRPGGDEADLSAAVMTLRAARDLVAELASRWEVWMQANGYDYPKGG